MIENGGSIINVTSDAGAAGYPGRGAFRTPRKPYENDKGERQQSKQGSKKLSGYSFNVS
jgi:hypothetical protein